MGALRLPRSTALRAKGFFRMTWGADGDFLWGKSVERADILQVFAGSGGGV